MPLDRMERILLAEVEKFGVEGRRKGREAVITGVLPAIGPIGPRYRIEGGGDRLFLRMNANNYLGMSLREEVIGAEEREVHHSGSGPGAVRFISGTWAPHVALERRLADFHGRDASIIFSSAYAAVMGTLPPLITPETAVFSDELNHNCIINAIRLARPRERQVYRHLDLNELDTKIRAAAHSCRRAIVVTDGIFSMRGDHAPLAEINALVRQYDAAFSENIFVVVDDSHGVGAFGATGRGTEEYTGTAADILIATLGKALGVNGGYVVASHAVIDYLRETSPFYVYSNPIAPGEAAGAAKAIDVLDGSIGRDLLRRLRETVTRFRAGLSDLGLETVPGDHPIVPLMVRDFQRTAALVRYLRENGILATALNFPIVPRGDEEIRFQISADHTSDDIDEVLGVLDEFRRRA